MGEPPERESFRPSPPAWGSTYLPFSLDERPDFPFQPRPRGFGRDPLELRQLVPEPCELALGVVAGVDLADGDGLVPRQLTRKMADQRWIAMRLHRRLLRIEPARGHSCRLLLRAPSGLRDDALVDPLIQRRAI